MYDDVPKLWVSDQGFVVKIERNIGGARLRLIVMDYRADRSRFYGRAFQTRTVRTPKRFEGSNHWPFQETGVSESLCPAPGMLHLWRLG